MSLAGELLHLGLAPRTVTLYVRTLATAEAWFDAHGYELRRATAEQVCDYLAERPTAWASRNLLRAALTHYWVIVEHPRAPVKAIRVPPKPAMVCLALDADDARILAKAARQRRDKPGMAVLLGLYEGLRREEIATARRSGVNGEWLTIIGKGSKSRTIPLHPIVVEALAELPVEGDYIFPGRFPGTSINPMTIWQWVREVSDEAGVAQVRPHRLRHTCLATANDNTADLRTVQAFAGHSRPETTAGYTRATAQRLQAVIASLDYET